MNLNDELRGCIECYTLNYGTHCGKCGHYIELLPMPHGFVDYVAEHKDG